jgi:hypothetical protein
LIADLKARQDLQFQVLKDEKGTVTDKEGREWPLAFSERIFKKLVAPLQREAMVALFETLSELGSTYDAVIRKAQLKFGVPSLQEYFRFGIRALRTVEPACIARVVAINTSHPETDYAVFYRVELSALAAEVAKNLEVSRYQLLDLKLCATKLFHLKQILEGRYLQLTQPDRGNSLGFVDLDTEKEADKIEAALQTIHRLGKVFPELRPSESVVSPFL